MSALVGTARHVDGQSTTSEQKGAKADAAVQLYTVPESPAFSFLDITPSKITRPTTARDFVTALINAIDESGHVKQGLAFEIAGSRLTGRQPSLTEYQKRFWKRATTRSQWSLATVRGAGDTSLTDVSYGVRIPVYDGGDPLADIAFTGSVIEEFRKCSKGRVPAPPTLPQDVQDARNALAEKEQLKCEAEALKTEGEAFAKDHWNDWAFSVAYAGGHRVASTLAKDTRELGNRFWAVGGMPLLGRSGQLLGLLQYANMVPDQANGHETSVRYGARATLGQPTMNAFLEMFRERASPAGLASLNRDGWSGGFEFKLADQLWLATGFGRATEVKGSPTIVIANLKWGVSSQAQYAR